MSRPTACTRSAAVLLAAVVLVAPRAQAADAPGVLRYDALQGVVLTAARATVMLDRAPARATPVLRFLPDGERPLFDPAVEAHADRLLRLTYRVDAPDGTSVTVRRTLRLVGTGDRWAVVEQFALEPARPITCDVEVERPFTVRAPGAPGAMVTLPLKTGWARARGISAAGLQAEYRLGNPVAGSETDELALPVVSAAGHAWQVAAMADPTFSALLSLNATRDGLAGSVRYRYRGSVVPLAAEARSFAFAVAPAPPAGRALDGALDAFFRFMLPDVPPGPRWLHDIALVDYDYLSDGGQGWERDVRALAAVLKPEERRRVALCFHGWYDALGSYCYDPSTKRMRDAWTAMARTRRVRLTQAEVRRRLRLARSLGFRVLMYFADGLLQDSQAQGYRSDWDFQDAVGGRVGGWQGPDTWGATYARNPANPAVVQWYADYLAALLRAYGPDLDGFVWDETFYLRTGHLAAKPAPAYADRAMLALVRRLAKQVHATDPQKVFLASDDVGLAGPGVPGYAMVADGTYQDSWCAPAAWSYGLFPNWRNTLWSCNWSPVANFHYTRWGVRVFGAPVAISNGWGDDRGPAEWRPRERDAFLRLFRERVGRLRHARQGGRARYLTRDPAELLATAPDRPTPGDPLPASWPGETNRALAADGARAAASSADDYGGGRYPASGAVDGRRDADGWGAGHGWASKSGQPLPQWLEVDFGRPHVVDRFVVITYEHDDSPETAGKWGVTDYDVQVREPGRTGWRTVVREARGRAVKARVHPLAVPISVEAFRVVVRAVAPIDGVARLLQVEAWGPRDP